MTTILVICGVWAAFCVLTVYAILRAGARCDGPHPESRSTDDDPTRRSSGRGHPASDHAEHDPVQSETDRSDAPVESERSETHSVELSSSEDEAFTVAKRSTPATRG